MSRSRVIVLAALLIGVTLLVYLPALHGGFIFDDDVFLTDNPLIRASDGLRRLWLSREAADYWPVTSTTFWLEWRLWGLSAVGYHATNVALHLAGVVVLWATLRRLRVPGALVGALLFAVHPLNVESVAWITERKNLLAMLFFLLSIYWFTGEKKREYWFSLGAFVLAMLSKGSVVFLPVVLLGAVAWHRRPDGRDVRRLAPFFLLAAGLTVVESQFSTVTEFAGLQPFWPLPPLLRAGAVVLFYAGKVVWPADLSFDYGPWDIRVNEPAWWLPLIAVVAVNAGLWHFRDRWSRAALFGWGYFGAALLPAMGFAEVGFMRFSPVSDHFAHLALPGACALAGAGWARLAGEPPRTFFTVGAAAVVAICGVLTWRQSAIYADAFTLYRDTIARNPNSWIAQTNLGALLGEAGKNDEAIAHLEAAVRLKPDWEEAHTDLGLAFYRAGRMPEAIAQYEAALRARSDSYHAHNNLGAALARSGRLVEAAPHFEEALRIRPDYRDAQVNLERAQRLLRDGVPGSITGQAARH